MFFMLSATIEDAEKNEAFREMYLIYAERLLVFAKNTLNGEETVYSAEDAVQETFCRILKALPPPKDVHSNETKNYLYITAKSVCLDFLRRRKKEKEAAFSTADIESFRFSLKELADDVIDRLSVEEICNAATRLPECLKFPFMLRYAKDLSYKSIGILLGISENTARNRAYRVRKIISEELKGVVFDE